VGFVPERETRRRSTNFKAGAREDWAQDYANGTSERLRADCISLMSEARPSPRLS
jgi:hypothetical protein